MQNHGCKSYALYTDPPKAIDHDFIVRQFEACALKIDFMLNELVQGLHCQLVNFFCIIILRKFPVLLLVLPSIWVSWCFFSLEVGRLQKAISLAKEDWISLFYGRPVNGNILRADERQVLIFSINKVDSSQSTEPNWVSTLDTHGEAGHFLWSSSIKGPWRIER